ncbi:MAG: hypothetical protein HYZ32_00755, partial [Hydrocarboniphaga effusa]|nr:hypothetical protein [Hydrocarboniphaga effusa]
MKQCSLACQVLAVSLLCALPAQAATTAASTAASRADLPDVRIPYQRHVLPNGLTLLLHEDHKAPIVAVNV